MATHSFLFDTFANGRNAVYTDNSVNRGMKEITILAETKVLHHGDQISLPVGSERIAGLFRHFGFHGENLDRIAEVRVLPFSPENAPPRSAQVTDFYRVQMPSILRKANRLIVESPKGTTITSVQIVTLQNTP